MSAQSGVVCTHGLQHQLTYCAGLIEAGSMLTAEEESTVGPLPAISATGPLQLGLNERGGTLGPATELSLAHVTASGQVSSTTHAVSTQCTAHPSATPVGISQPGAVMRSPTELILAHPTARKRSWDVMHSQVDIP